MDWAVNLFEVWRKQRNKKVLGGKSAHLQHRSLSQDQLTLCHSVDGSLSYLMYTEKYSKTNRRGLKDYNVNRKIVRAYADPDNPARCLVFLYRKYLSLCPDVGVSGPVYLTPLKKPTPEKWFSTVPVGKNTLGKTVSKLCRQAGFEGKFCHLYAL
jgi:hypothetical protein